MFFRIRVPAPLEERCCGGGSCTCSSGCNCKCSDCTCDWDPPS